MEDYIVSARKYRPLTFDSVVGQMALTTTLKHAVKSGKLAHAFLFCGPRGVGKTTCARIFAKAINCLNPNEEGEACNECESCKAFNEQRSFNIFELDAASNNSVENIKTLMEQTRVPPQVGKYKVFIIDEVHMLSQAAFNAFLKTLEEPPAYVIFILATTEKHKILPTILSRCQVYDFERMTVSNTVNHLKMVAEKEGIAYEEEALTMIAEKADGGMRDALSIFDQTAGFCQGNITYNKVIENLGILDIDTYFKMVDLSLENKVADLMVVINHTLSRGFDGLNLINGLAKHIRNVLMANNPETTQLLETSENMKQRYAQQAQRCTPQFMYKAIKLLNQCDLNYRTSSNKRLLVELTLIQVAQITQEEDGESVGHCPKRLKSLFRKKTISQSQTAQQVAGKGMAVAQQKPADAIKNNVEEKQNTETSSPATTNTKPVSLSGMKMGKLNLGSMGLTFADIKRGPEKASANTDIEEEVTNKEEQKVFTQENLEYEWLLMCNRMPQSMIAMAQRMKNITPVITTFPEIEIKVDNALLLEQIKEIKGRIRASLAEALHNGQLQIVLRQAELSEIKPIPTKRELFEEMVKNNNALNKLVNELNLDLS